MIGDIVNTRHIEAAALPDSATKSATQFKLAVTNALVMPTVHADCMFPAWVMPQYC
jgi:hypothetical protein